MLTPQNKNLFDYTEQIEPKTEYLENKERQNDRTSDIFSVKL